MTLTFSDIFIGVVLFTCVPLQYLLVKNWGSAESSRSYFLVKSLDTFLKFRDEYLDPQAWLRWIDEIFGNEPFDDDPISDSKEGESLAVEVMKFQHEHGYLTFSTEPRSIRPPNVLFHIGQVVVHKRRNYKGVIIGWDEVAKAPPEWLESFHGRIDERLRTMPNYIVIIDTTYKLIPQLTYIPQEELELVQSQIFHPMLDDHFERFDGAQYIPRPWLRAMYPRD